MGNLSHLDELEAEAIYIIREVAAEFEKPVMLYSIGKDSSVMLHLAMKAFYPEKPPFPFLHVDTTWKFKEMIEFRDKMAKKLGIAYYDKNIIGQIAEKSGLSPEYIQENAELSPKKGLFAYAFSGRDITGKSVEDMVYEVQRNIILELAEKEPCVIIGRNADYILKDRDDVLNVFIHGDMPEKIKRITGLYNVKEKEAVKMMADTDKRRRTNYNFYTDQNWGKASNYTLCLNSSQLGYDRCEMIIMECVK